MLPKQTEHTALLHSAWRRPDVLVASLALNILALALAFTILQVYDRIIPNRADDTFTLLLLALLVVIALALILRLLRSYLLTREAARFGTVPGKVRRLSATTYLDEQLQPYYRAEIALTRDHLGERSGALRIIPGMRVVAGIQTGSKSVLDYLLKPIRRGLDNSFIER